MEGINNYEEENPFDKPINELESALKTFVSIYNLELIDHKTNQELIKKNAQSSNEQMKKNIEQSIQDMYEKAQNLELQFLKYRLDISNKTPEQLIKEEIECLKAELARKDDLLAETKDKLEKLEQQVTHSTSDQGFN